MRALAALLTAFLLTACSTTNIGFHPNWDPGVKPSYEDYFDYYWLGFAGQHTVDLQKVCLDQTIYGVRSQRTFEDVLYSAITFGIWMPVTVKVWCGEGQAR